MQSATVIKHRYVIQNILLCFIPTLVDEDRFYCFGRLGEGIATVRFTYRDQVIRIFGAGYWRKGKRYLYWTRRTF